MDNAVRAAEITLHAQLHVVIARSIVFVFRVLQGRYRPISQVPEPVAHKSCAYRGGIRKQNTIRDTAIAETEFSRWPWTDVYHNRIIIYAANGISDLQVIIRGGYRL